MTLTNIIKTLFEQSEFNSPNSLALHTGQTQPFTDAFINGTKSARIKEDILFDELTKGITGDEFFSALELVKVVRQSQNTTE